MLSFSGYFDTAGAEHQGEFIVTAGVWATVEQWDVFDRRWLSVLEAYDLSAFHMWQIAHWKGDIAKWPLRGGKPDDERRRQLLSDLAEVAAMIPQAAVRGVHLADYRAANERFLMAEAIGGGPYALSQAMCLIQSMEL